MKVKEIADVLCYGGPVYLKSANGVKIQSCKTDIVDLLVYRVHADSEIDFIVAKEDHVSIFIK